MEALSAAFRSTLHPRIGGIEVTRAIFLVVIGIVTLIGIVTSTPDDRRDKELIALMYGGLLWGVLAALTATSGKCTRAKPPVRVADVNIPVSFINLVHAL
jgi:hypothetical protein